MVIIFENIMLKTYKNRVKLSELQRAYGKFGMDRVMKYLRHKYMPKGLKIIDDIEFTSPSIRPKERVDDGAGVDNRSSDDSR